MKFEEGPDGRAKLARKKSPLSPFVDPRGAVLLQLALQGPQADPEFLGRLSPIPAGLAQGLKDGPSLHLVHAQHAAATAAGEAEGGSEQRGGRGLGRGGGPRRPEGFRSRRRV